MSPSPILQYSIHNILQYISPPSQLLEPLPSHLISKSLYQRHHFLNINPSSSYEYLCWPSPNTAFAINLLESFVRPANDDEYATYPVRYSSDGEWVYAHVHVCSDHGALRIVFQWDETDGWKYHDANVMPFPHGSYTSLQDAISGPLLNDPDQSKFIEDQSLGYGTTENDVDTYWDVYGKASIFHMKNNQDCMEDSYWAQYASVQGSGDSTQPSPLPHTRHKLRLVEPTHPTSDSPIVFSHPSFHSRCPIEGPSPSRLTDRLNAISSRSASPLFFSGSNSTTLSADSTTVIDTDYNEPLMLNIKDVSLRDTQTTVKGRAEEVEEALRQSIRGVMQLWKAGRRNHFVTPPVGRQEENELFLHIVREVVEEP